ncbi:MAG: hypothetical protein JNK05_40160 [Myxococcales bacterium]|nr:hypothetical protein [Myxococcales bacterium]
MSHALVWMSLRSSLAALVCSGLVLAACAGHPRTAARVSVAPLTPSRSIAASVVYDLGDWVVDPHSSPTIVAEDRDRTLIIDGAIRVVVWRSGVVEVARHRTRKRLARWFERPDHRWVFIDEDSVVLTAPTFLADFDDHAELPDELRGASPSSGAMPHPLVRTTSAWWSLDDPAHPRRIRAPIVSTAYAMRYVTDNDVLALVAPGKLVFSRNRGHAWRALDVLPDTPVRLEALSDDRVAIVGRRNVWAFDRTGVVAAIGTAPQEEATDAPIDDEALSRWAAFRRMHLWPVCRRALGFAEHGGVALRVNDRGLSIEHRDGRRIEVESEFLGPCGVRPFGDKFSLVCRNEGGPVGYLVDPRHRTIVAAEPESDEAFRRVWFAADGSAIVVEPYNGGPTQLWLEAGGWRPSAWLEAARLQLLANHRAFVRDERGIREVRLDGRAGDDGRLAIDFDALGVERSRLETVVSITSTETQRTWLFSTGDGQRCVVVLEGNGRTSSITVDRCDEIVSALFLDERFGVVAGPTEYRVTRDGRSWRSFARADIGVDEASDIREYDQPFESEGAIVLSPGHRIARVETSTHAVARSTSLGPDPYDDSYESPMAFACAPRGRARVTPARVSATDLLLLGEDAQVRVREIDRSANVTIDWRLRGRSFSTLGVPNPWDLLQGGSRYASLVDAGPHGAIVLQFRLFTTPQPNATAVAIPELLALSASSGRAEFVRLHLPNPGLRVLLTDWFGDRSGWVFVFRVERSDAVQVHQWIRLDADARVIARGELVHDTAETVRGLASIEGQWGLVVGGASWRFESLDRTNESEFTWSAPFGRCQSGASLRDFAVIRTETVLHFDGPPNLFSRVPGGRVVLALNDFPCVQRITWSSTLRTVGYAGEHDNASLSAEAQRNGALEGELRWSAGDRTIHELPVRCR